VFIGYKLEMAQATAEKMRAVAIGRPGGLDELKIYDLPKPEPAAGEVLIRVRAAGVGIWDSKNRAGERLSDDVKFPLVLGAECAGDIEQLGEGVTTLHDKDAVYTYFEGKQGAYAQYVAVKAEFVALKPTSLSYLEAASVPVVSVTAHQALVDDLNVQPNEWVYVAGGAGGVGTMAVQIASVIGAHVIASARAQDFDYLESLGVLRTNLIDYERSDIMQAVRDLTGGLGADAALDAVGGDSSKTTIRAVKDGGRLAELTGADLPQERKITIIHTQSQPSAKRLDTLRAMFDAGQLKVHVLQSFPLEHARGAQEAVEQPHGPGEIVISVD
jgi:NADPH:quinone reductase-like Zn-dependent oxidoreductase